MQNPRFNKKVKRRNKLIRLVCELSEMHESTINALAEYVTNDSEYSSLLSLTRDGWKSLINDKIIEIPKHITGDTKEDRIEKYASELQQRVEKIFPGDLMNIKLVSSKILLTETAKDVKSILKKSKQLGFNLSKTEINAFFCSKLNNQLWPALKDSEKLKKELKSWQRLYRITPEASRYESIEILRKANLGSASEIVKEFTRKAFRKKFGKSIGNETADIIYNNAKDKLTNKG